MTNFVTPVGRLVQGSLSQGSTKSFKGEDLVWKSGQNQGQPRTEYYVGLAIPKTDPGVAELFAAMQATATAGYPGGESNNADFAWKYIDGDTVDAKGKPYAEREGHAGCYIFRLSTSYPVKCSQPDSRGNQVVIPAEQIKKGYYIRIAGSVTAGDKVNPSIFMNMNMCELVGYGEEIVSGPDANAVFNAPAALPAGASATPLATPGGAFEAAATPAPAPAPAPTPAPAPAPTPAPTLQAAPTPMATPTAPNPGFVQAPGLPGQ